MRSFAFVLASASALATSSGAAADLALQPLPTAVPPAWTGFYVGANGGVASQWNTVQDTNSWASEGILNISSKTIGGTAGAQTGYNIQDGNFLYGIEGDWNWTGIKNDRSLSDTCSCGGTVGAQIHAEMDWVATIRGRGGLVVGDTLAYATAGVAWAGFSNHWGAGFTDPAAACGGPPACGPINNGNFLARNTQIGWAVGFGIEHMLTAYPHVTLKLEAMWLDFGNRTVTNAGPSFVTGSPGPFSSQFQNQAALARVGLNYKF